MREAHAQVWMTWPKPRSELKELAKTEAAPMARPKKERADARGLVFGVRLTPDERATLEANAAALGVTITDYARAAVLGGRVEVARLSSSGGAPEVPPAGVAHIVALNRVGVNLNQIARALNSGLGVVPSELTDSLARVNALLDDWQGVRA